VGSISATLVPSKKNEGSHMFPAEWWIIICF
jgi:hypothetical protein